MTNSSTLLSVGSDSDHRKNARHIPALRRVGTARRVDVVLDERDVAQGGLHASGGGRLARGPTVARDSESPRASATALGAHLAALPEARATRISVARYRGTFQHGDSEYADVVELGGSLVPGPCGCEEIARRYGSGDYRVTAYGFEPPGVRWELIVEDLAHA